MVAMARNALLIALLGACDGADGPRIDAVEPASAAPGARVVLTGTDFCGAAERVGPGAVCEPLPAGSVSFGIDPVASAIPSLWLDGRIDVDVPAQLPAGDVLIVVTVDGRSSNGVSFRVR